MQQATRATAEEEKVQLDLAQDASAGSDEGNEDGVGDLKEVLATE